jgi:hypothetical protein
MSLLSAPLFGRPGTLCCGGVYSSVCSGTLRPVFLDYLTDSFLPKKGSVPQREVVINLL